jgi:hypothetical protein
MPLTSPVSAYVTLNQSRLNPGTLSTALRIGGAPRRRGPGLTARDGFI